MLAAENWCLKVADKVYGPYTSEQLRKYACAGRLAAWSLIAPAGSRAWREAGKEPALSNVFGISDVALNKEKGGPVFGKRGADDDGAAGEPSGSADCRIANFIVVFDVVSAAASKVEAAIMSLGHAFLIADNVWSVTCELTAVGVRNAIAPYLSLRESIFVVDATRGRSSWQNYPPEKHAKITAAYHSARPKDRAQAC